MSREQIARRAAKLLSVKSIVTIVLTVVFAVLSIRGSVTAQDFLTVFLMVISFYFGTQAEKKQSSTSEEES